MNERILIVLMGSLGDVVRGLAVAEQIRTIRPDHAITWLVEPRCEGILRLAASVEDIVVFNRAAPLRGILELRRELLQRRCTVVLDMQRHFKSGFFSWLSGAPRRIGFHPKNTKEGNWIFNNEYIPFRAATLNKFYHYQEFVAALGISPTDSPVISWRAIPSPEPELQPGTVAIVLGSTWSSKDWVVEGYAELISELVRAGRPVVLLGDNSHAALGAQLVGHASSPSVVNYAGRTSLAQLVGILGSCAVVVGPDSGPGHIAAAVGKRYVSLFGPTSPKRVAPLGSENLVVSAPIGCAPCNRRTCPGVNKVCMRLIRVPDVLGKVEIAFRSGFE